MANLVSDSRAARQTRPGRRLGSLTDVDCAPPLIVQIEPEAICSEQRRGDSVDEACRAVPEHFVLQAHVEGGPPTLEIQLTRDEAVLLEQVLTPSYETTRPNGPDFVLLCRRHHRFVHEHGFHVNRDGAALVFTRPNGEVVPTVPRSQRIDADAGCAALLKVHAESGLQMAPRTAVPRWMGERMDYGEAVGALRDRAQNQPSHNQS
jgi:hypothetical protein